LPLLGYCMNVWSVYLTDICRVVYYELGCGRHGAKLASLRCCSVAESFPASPDDWRWWSNRYRDRLQRRQTWRHTGKYCHYRALAGPWKSLNFFSRFSRPGKSLKTDTVLESPWICVWRSLKVLELDFLKRRRLHSALLLVEGFWGPEICLECVVGRGCAPDPTGGAHDTPSDRPDPLVG